jgi:hypothetical protein
MSNFVFDDGKVGVIFATMQLYAVSAADMTPYLMFTRINQADNEVNWSFYLGVTVTNVAFETTSLPWLLQRRSKVFCAQPLKGTTGNGGVFLVKFETSTGLNIIANPAISGVII